MTDERKAFEAWLKAAPDWAPEFEQHRAWVEQYAFMAWRDATLAERERAAKVVETQDTCGDYVGGWFSLLAEKIRKG